MTTTREKILRAAQRLLGQSGLSGAGLNQVIAASGAPRGSVYYHFPEGKVQWVGEALVAYGDYFCSFAGGILDRDASLGANIESLLLTLANGMEQTKCNQGCPIGAVSLDLDESSEALRGICQTAVSQWENLFERHLPGMDKVRRNQMAGFIVSTIEGALMLSRIEGDARPLRTAAVILRGLVDRELADAAT